MQKACQYEYVYDVPTALGELHCNSEPEELRDCRSSRASVEFLVTLLTLPLLLVRFPTKLALRVAGLVQGGRSTSGISGQLFHTTVTSSDRLYLTNTERNGIGE